MVTETLEDWAQLRELLEADAPASEIEQFLDSLPAAEVLPAVFHLKTDEQRQLLALISAERAAHIVEELPEGYAADLMEVMQVADVAPIVGEMSSDDRVDVLGEFSAPDSLPLSMGQLLSIPAVIAGFALLFRAWKNPTS